MDEQRIREVVRAAVSDLLGDDVPIADRWEGGTLVFLPGQPGSAPKEIPIDSFWKKVIAVRERLRVLEQKINNHASLSAPEKLELQGYLTGSFGSLTTFNAFFEDEDDRFRGTGGA